ncbi:TetR/AcrR family transcriptional regulator [Agromyces bauzanensis]
MTLPTLPTLPTSGADAPTRVPARERLLSAADGLFYGQGINTTGVEQVASEAHVTKATLYNNFRSKEQLVAAYLERRLDGWLQAVRAGDRPDGTPEQRVGAFFDLLVRDAHDERFRGCPFTNAAVEMPGSTLVMEVVRAHRRNILEHIEALIGDAGGPELARSIVLLYDGAMVAVKTAGDVGAISTARELSVRFVGAAASDPR